jgi:hypothetical protein
MSGLVYSARVYYPHMTIFLICHVSNSQAEYANEAKDIGKPIQVQIDSLASTTRKPLSVL